MKFRMFFALLCILLGLKTALAQDKLVNPNAPSKANDKEIGKNLATLEKWPSFGTYSYYFVVLPKYLNLQEVYANEPGLNKIGNDVRVFPYKKQGATASITLKIPNEGIAAMREVANGRLVSMCVVLDGIAGGVLPVEAAEVFSTGYAYGYVTRVVIGGYVENQGTLSLIGKRGLPQIPAQFIDIKSYQQAPGFVYQANLPRLLQEYDLLAAGMLYGWKAADELETDKIKNPAYAKAAWSLAKSRFTTGQMGEAVGFTLNYLLGYIRAALTRDKATNDVKEIHNNLCGDPEVQKAKSLVTLFHSTLLHEHHMFALNTKMPANDRENILQHYKEFIEGFNAGSVNASEDVFVRVFELGYRAGYKDGFKDGYAKGYADGYRDGYIDGNQAAWNQANKIIEQLRTELEKEKNNTVAKIVGSIAHSRCNPLAALIRRGKGAAAEWR
jgi:hypothetical protein